MSISLSDAPLAKVASVGLAGLTAGALLFVSCVDAPSAVTRNAPVFDDWWPRGARLMPTLIVGTTAAHGAAYALTNEFVWLYSGLAFASIVPYTLLVMRDDIAALRDPTSDPDVHAPRFALRHHARTLTAVGAFGLGLHAIARNL